MRDMGLARLTVIVEMEICFLPGISFLQGYQVFLCPCGHHVTNEVYAWSMFVTKDVQVSQRSGFHRV